MAEPQHTAGIRLHRPRPVRCSACPPRSSPSCAAPPRSGGTRSRAAPCGFDDEGYWVGHQARRRRRGLQEQRPVLQLGEHRDHPARAAGRPRRRSMLQRLILLNIDPPQHTKLRGIISRGFTPRAISNLREVLTERAERIVQTALAEGTGDFVADVACELPLQAIAELLGVPQEDRRQDLRLVQPDDRLRRPRVRAATPDAAAAELLGYCDGDGRGPQAVPARRHRHQAGQRRRSTAASCPPTSSASS